MSASGLAPERLELEVTESLWLQNTDAVLDQLSQLRKVGISIALDHFGTGYSSLTYLWRFPFDRLKIDRAFVMDMEDDQKARAIVHTMIELGAVLDLSITAEGVETQEQFQALKEAGCDQAQGFFLGLPLSAELANALVDADRAGQSGNSRAPILLEKKQLLLTPFTMKVSPTFAEENRDRGGLAASPLPRHRPPLRWRRSPSDAAPAHTHGCHACSVAAWSSRCYVRLRQS